MQSFNIAEPFMRVNYGSKIILVQVTTRSSDCFEHFLASKIKLHLSYKNTNYMAKGKRKISEFCVVYFACMLLNDRYITDSKWDSDKTILTRVYNISNVHVWESNVYGQLHRTFNFYVTIHIRWSGFVYFVWIAQVKLIKKEQSKQKIISDIDLEKDKDKDKGLNDIVYED